MAGPRERSRHRGMESQDQYELQDMQSSHLNPTGEDSTAQCEGSYDDRNHGHLQNLGAQHLDRRLLWTCKQRLDGILGTCKARSERFMSICMEPLTKHRMMKLFIASVFCTLLLLAFRGLDPRAEPPNYGLDRSTGRATELHQLPSTVTRHHTVYRTISVNYNQFYGARPVHHQAPMAVPSSLELMGRAKLQDLSHPYVGTRTSSSVSGLYFMPTSVTDRDWPQTQQGNHPSFGLTTNAQASQYLQGSQSSGKSKIQAELLLQYREIGAPLNLSTGQADADPTSFTRWGVELCYELRRRSREWCMENACSPHERLISLCHATNTISNPFRKQECEWCWPEDQRKQLEIEKHCTEVSKRAFNAMIISCGIFLFCTLIIAITLAPRMLRHMKIAKVDRIVHENAATAFPVLKKSKSVLSYQLLHRISKSTRSSKVAKSKLDEKAKKKGSLDENVDSNPWYKPVLAKSEKRSSISPKKPASSQSRLQKQRTKPLDHEIVNRDSDSHERVPVLPPAPPAISSRVFSEIENMGQGSLLSGTGNHSSQHYVQGMPRRSARQSRAVNSGSEQLSSEAMQRRDAGRSSFNDNQ